MSEEDQTQVLASKHCACQPTRKYSPGRHPTKRSLGCYIVLVVSVLLFWVGTWETLVRVITLVTREDAKKEIPIYAAIALCSGVVILIRYNQGHEETT